MRLHPDSGSVSLSHGDACVDVLAECKKRHAPVGGGGLEGRVGFEPTTPGLKVGFPFVPHPALLAESAGEGQSALREDESCGLARVASDDRILS